MLGSPVFGIAILLFGVGLAAVLTWGAMRTFQTATQIADLPPSEIGSLSPGMHKVRGKAVALGELLSAPLSETPCVYYEFRGSQTIGGGFSFQIGDFGTTNRAGFVMLNDIRSVAWAIEDQTGRVRVDPKECEATLTRHLCEKSWHADEIPVRIRRILEQTRFYPHNARKGSFEGTEACLTVGTEVVVIGHVVETEGGLGFATVSSPLLITDGSESALAGKHRRWAVVQLAIAAVFLVAFGYLGVWQSQPAPAQQPPGPGKAPNR